jgi:hypothetical protein
MSAEELPLSPAESQVSAGAQAAGQSFDSDQTHRPTTQPETFGEAGSSDLPATDDREWRTEFSGDSAEWPTAARVDPAAGSAPQPQSAVAIDDPVERSSLMVDESNRSVEAIPGESATERRIAGIVASIDENLRSAARRQDELLERLDEVLRRTLATHDELGRLAERVDQLEAAQVLRGRL